jgi:hypothetical protein
MTSLRLNASLMMVPHIFQLVGFNFEAKIGKPLHVCGFEGKTAKPSQVCVAHMLPPCCLHNHFFFDPMINKLVLLVDALTWY